MTCSILKCPLDTGPFHDTTFPRLQRGSVLCQESGLSALYRTMALPTTKAHPVLTRQQYRLNNAYMRCMRNGTWLVLLLFLIISTSYYLVQHVIHYTISEHLELTIPDPT